MARIREQNEKIKQRRLVSPLWGHPSPAQASCRTFQDVAADEDAFKQTQAAERQRQAQIRKVQETVNRTREQSARRKLDKIQSREWDSDKKAEGWSTNAKAEQPMAVSSDSTTRTNTGDVDAGAEASPTAKPREGGNRGRGRGSGRRGRGDRGRGRGGVRDKAPPASVPEEKESSDKVEEGK